ncbi:hypothetical protein B7494_g8149 [Chlorociboria aeruginascens]|nr:hypothetical protein B7494_g8149 [Chlorociboria aeruginascens]
MDNANKFCFIASLACGPEPLSSFLGLEYIEGKKLSFAQLKTLGRAANAFVYFTYGFEVRKQTVSVDINKQELGGLQPSKIQASYYNDDVILAFANAYVKMWRARGSIFQGQGENALYHLDMIRQYIEKWVDGRLDRGLFVLVHGNLEPFNLTVNENMNIVSVRDWEESGVVPSWDFVYKNYLKSFKELHANIRIREHEKYGNELLSTKWAKAKVDSGFLLANALENWTDIDWFANQYIN